MKFLCGVSTFLCIVQGTQSFQAPLRHAGTTTKFSIGMPFVSVPTTTQLRMAEGGDSEPSADGAKLKSVQKEISYDEATGRFYETAPDECAPEAGEFCTVDEKTGKMIQLTTAEKERIFLDALQSYYATGRQMLSDEDFDLLKEDLTWNGSQMVVMNRKEVRFLSAVQAYLKGDPIMSDDEYNTLKLELKEDNSIFAVTRQPKCYIDTGICTVTLKEDNFRTNLLYFPSALISTIVWLGFGYEFIEPIIRLNPIILLLLGTYPIYLASKKITDDFVFQNAKIAFGPCPSCETENRIYFGDILFTEGFKDVADVKCTNCKSVFQVQRNSLRASTLPKE